MYDYLFLTLDGPRGTPPARAFAERVRGRKAAVETAGGQVLGLFTPQLGWVARQAALLVRWNADAKGRDHEMTALGRLDGVLNAERGELQATSRPAATDQPPAGGIYVHRWFVVDAKAVPEFLELSVQGWRDFEARFDTHIFGLFTAERTVADRQKGNTRLLLITRYKDHGVWEASRDPTTEAMAAFARRQLLTEDSWAASTLLTVI